MKKEVALSSLVLSQALAPFSSSALADTYDINPPGRIMRLSANLTVGDKPAKLTLKLQQGPFLGVNNEEGNKNKEFAYKAWASMNGYTLAGDGNLVFELDPQRSNAGQQTFLGSVCSSSWTGCESPDGQSEIYELTHDVVNNNWILTLKTSAETGMTSVDLELNKQVLKEEKTR